MMRALVEGLLAEWGIAIPVGAVAVLILERFVAAAFTAPLSWQAVLAGIGVSVGQRLGSRAVRSARLIGALIVLAFAVRIAARAVG